MTKVKFELECLKKLLKRDSIVKIVNELPDKETADLNYIYIIPKEGEGKDKKAYVLRPDRSGFDTIDLTPQLVNVVGEGHITVEKETLNENGDVTFTVTTSSSFKTLLESLTSKGNELDNKVSTLEAKNAEQDTKLAGHDTDISNLKSKDVEVDTSLETLRTNVGKVTELANANKEAIGVNKADADAKHNALASRVNVLEEAKPVVENKFTEIESKNTAQDEKITALENRTDNFINNVSVSKADGKVKLTYSRVDGSSSEVEFDDSDTVTLAYDDEPLKTRIKALEDKESKATVYDDSAVRGQITALESKVDANESTQEAKNSELEGKITALENKVDIDNQTLTLEDHTLSISRGNVVTIPKYDDSSLKAKNAEQDEELKALKEKTKSFLTGANVTRQGNVVTLTYTNIDGSSTNLEFNDNDTKAIAYDDTALKARVQELEKRADADDGNVHEDNDTHYNVKSTTDGLTVVKSQENGEEVFTINADVAFQKHYTKGEVDKVIADNNKRTQTLTKYSAIWKVPDAFKYTNDGRTPVLSYNNVTSFGNMKLDGMFLKPIPYNTIICEFPPNTPKPVEFIELQTYIGNEYISMWYSDRVVRVTEVPKSLVGKRIIFNFVGLFA